jgi:integrase
MFDEVIARYFEDEESFRKAMRILGAYDTEATGDWKTSVEPFLMTLDDWESHLLEQAIGYRTERDGKSYQSSTPPDDTRLERLEQTIQVLAERHTPLRSKPVSELIDTYLLDIQQGWDDKNIETNTRDIKPKITLLVDVLGNIESKELRPDHIVDFKGILFRLPSNRTKGKCAGKSIDDLLSLPNGSYKLMGVNTVKNYANKVSSFLKWMAKHNYAISGLENSLLGITSPDKPPHEERPSFEDDELHRLFESKQYIRGTHKKASHYWVPLLALFTGARQSELCQLYKSDIYKEKKTGILVFDINSEKDKKLKKPFHARIVPIHKQLIELGFLDYVDSVKGERVFPDITKQRDGYGQQMSKWFCRTYLNSNNCDIRKESENADAVFHSFRHTVETQLDHDHEIPAHHIAHLVGQKPPGASETTGRYIKPKELRARQKMVNKLRYPSINFQRIRHWKHGYHATS